MSRNLSLHFEYYTGKPSKRVKRTSKVELCQTSSEITDKILGNNNRQLLCPILNNYYDWVRSIWPRVDAEDYIQRFDAHIQFYMITMKATAKWGAS